MEIRKVLTDFEPCFFTAVSCCHYYESLGNLQSRSCERDTYEMSRLFIYFLLGAAVGDRLTAEQAKLCMVHDLYGDLSPLAVAYAKARGKSIV